MTQGLARYHVRSPRYILSTEDDFLIRVAGPRQMPWEEGTQIKNVSLTGLAFTAPEDLCPLLGEFIRIQFVVPGGKQTACHAIVTRLEEYDTGVMLVGVHFYKMEMSHRIYLAQSLSRRFREQLSQRNDETLDERPSWRQVAAMGLIFLSLWMWVSLTFALLSWGPSGLWAAFRLLMP